MKQSRENAKREYDSFLEHTSQDHCYICKKPLKTFSKTSPCPHWLLRPHGVKKNHIFSILQLGGYHRCSSYLRWFANYEGISRNINDLLEEGDTEAYFHWTCRYKHLQWTFKCSKTDLKGHPGSQHTYPHYHFEMRLSGQIFVKFGEFHAPFNDEDLFWFRCNEDPDSPVKQTFSPHGAGMQDALNVDPEVLIETLSRGETGSEDKAVFQLDSFIFREEGISGEEIQKIINASKASGKTLAYHLKEAGLNPSVIISPARNIVDKADRTPRKRGKKS